MGRSGEARGRSERMAFMGAWSRIKKSVSKAVKDVVKETGRAAKKTERTFRGFDSTDWLAAAYGIFGVPYMVYDHNKEGIKRMFGLDVPEDPTPSDSDTALTETNEGADEADDSTLKRRRLGAQYSLGSTRATKGKLLGGAAGSPGTGGGTTAKLG